MRSAAPARHRRRRVAAFQDFAFWRTGPVTGLLADGLGHSVVFLFGSIAASLDLALVALIAHRSPDLTG